MNDREALNRIAQPGNTIAIDGPTIARLAYDGLIVSRTALTLTERGERWRATLNAHHEHATKGKAA